MESITESITDKTQLKGYTTLLKISSTIEMDGEVFTFKEIKEALLFVRKLRKGPNPEASTDPFAHTYGDRDYW